MILIADCSALIALASCDGLHLLDALFGTVIVPEAVYREAIVNDKPEAQRLKEYLINKVRKIDPNSPVLLNGFSDLGETEAMVLYKQCSADKLLIDDKRGRRVAKINAISTIGSLGVLLAAKQARFATQPTRVGRQAAHPTTTTGQGKWVLLQFLNAATPRYTVLINIPNGSCLSERSVLGDEAWPLRRVTTRR